VRHHRYAWFVAAAVLMAACGSSQAAAPGGQAAGAAPTAAEPDVANPGNPSATRPSPTTAPPVSLTWPVAPTTATPPSTTAPAPTAASAAPTTAAVVESLPQIVKPLDPPSGTGPVPTDPVKLASNPSRPVGVPLLPGEQGYVSCQVSIIGDSLTVAGGNAIADALRGNGCAAVAIAAKGGANIRYGVRLARDLQDAALMTDIVLVDMGTNDCASSAKEIDAAIDQMFGVIGPDRLVVWPTTNIARKTPYCEPDGDLLANERIIAATARHPNMRVVDWWPIADQHPEWHPDGVHQNREGMKAWAYVLAQGVSDAVAQRGG
jgi:hypothetical protein